MASPAPLPSSLVSRRETVSESAAEATSDTGNRQPVSSSRRTGPPPACEAGAGPASSPRENSPPATQLNVRSGSQVSLDKVAPAPLQPTVASFVPPSCNPDHFSKWLAKSLPEQDLQPSPGPKRTLDEARRLLVARSSTSAVLAQVKLPGSRRAEASGMDSDASPLRHAEPLAEAESPPVATGVSRFGRILARPMAFWAGEQLVYADKLQGIRGFNPGSACGDLLAAGGFGSARKASPGRRSSKASSSGGETGLQALADAATSQQRRDARSWEEGARCVEEARRLDFQGEENIDLGPGEELEQAVRASPARGEELVEVALASPVERKPLVDEQPASPPRSDSETRSPPHPRPAPSRLSLQRIQRSSVERAAAEIEEHVASICMGTRPDSGEGEAKTKRGKARDGLVVSGKKPAVYKKGSPATTKSTPGPPTSSMPSSGAPPPAQPALPAFLKLHASKLTPRRYGRCGECDNCLNPHRKRACSTPASLRSTWGRQKRSYGETETQRLMEALEVRGASSAQLEAAEKVSLRYFTAAEAGVEGDGSRRPAGKRARVREEGDAAEGDAAEGEAPGLASPASVADQDGAPARARDEGRPRGFAVEREDDEPVAPRAEPKARRAKQPRGGGRGAGARKRAAAEVGDVGARAAGEQGSNGVSFDRIPASPAAPRPFTQPSEQVEEEEGAWTAEEDALLHRVWAAVPPTTPRFWETVGGVLKRSALDCANRWMAGAGRSGEGRGGGAWATAQAGTRAASAPAGRGRGRHADKSEHRSPSPPDAAQAPPSLRKARRVPAGKQARFRAARLSSREERREQREQLAVAEGEDPAEVAEALARQSNADRVIDQILRQRKGRALGVGAGRGPEEVGSGCGGPTLAQSAGEKLQAQEDARAVRSALSQCQWEDLGEESEEEEEERDYYWTDEDDE